MSSLTLEQILDYNSQLPEGLYSYGINPKFPFLFLDFEVFAHDWLVCFSVDGVNIKTIVNDANKLKTLICDKLSDRISIAYNGNNYDKFINLAAINGIDVKEVNDKLINSFNFNFNFAYADKIKIGKELKWYDPSSRLGGSLKTYEACEGENIYESNVDFNLDRKLTQEEIDETISYCSFDVKMLIKYFYKENFGSFLGHLGLVLQTIEKRKGTALHYCLAKTDASLVGMYLCTSQGIDTTKPKDVIVLPDNLDVGKYKPQIDKFLEVPIKTLKNGSYNGLNSWCIKTINKSIDAANDETNLQKLKNKEQKTIDKIKKSKLEIKKLQEKDESKITEKQKQKLIELPNTIQECMNELQNIRNDISLEEEKLQKLKELVSQLHQYECDDFCNSNYNYIASKIVELAHVTGDTGSVKDKVLLLHNYLSLTKDELLKYRYIEDKKNTIFNSIMITYPFEAILNIKGIPHAFKTGGIHSIANKPLFFDKNSEKDKDKKLIIADVGSLYPNLMRVFGLCSIGMDNPDEFGQMIFDRIALKKKKDPFANVLKLILNTTYGCMGAEFNPLYDPTNRLKVCIFGQCAIVDLLDKLENQIETLEIYQSNTDGIVVACHEREYDLCEAIIHDWERRTGLEMEIDNCYRLIQKDVSNYILIQE